MTEPFFPFLFTSRFTVFFHVFFSASWNRKKPIKEIIMLFKERKMTYSKTMVTRSHQTGLAASKINGKTHLGWNYFPLNFFYPMESFKIYGIFNEVLFNSLYKCRVYVSSRRTDFWTFQTMPFHLHVKCKEYENKDKNFFHSAYIWMYELLIQIRQALILWKK